MWSGHRGGMVSWETSAAEGEQDSLGLWEEKPQGPESNQAEPPSQESSSRYVEETVAGIAQLKLGTPPHEMESPMAQVLRMRHLLVMPSTSTPENLLGTDLAVAQYKPCSSIQMFQEQATLVNIAPHPPHTIQLPTYAPELRHRSASSPVTGPPYTYLKLLSLFPSFEP